MTNVRRIAVIVALLVALVAASPASGHSCATPVRIEPGQAATVNIGVAAEEAPVVSVEVAVPEAFELDRVLEAPGWTSTTDMGVIRFTGGKIAAFGCAYFGVAGTAEKKATLAFPLTVGTEDGKERRLASRTPGAADAAQLVYAGTEPAAQADGDDEAGGTSKATMAVVGLGVAGGLAGAAWAVRYALAGSTGRPPPPPTRPAARGRARTGSGPSRKPSKKRQKPRRR